MSTELQKIQQEVFARRPVLLDIIRQYGQASVIDYVQNFWEVPEQKPNELFLAVFKNELLKIYDQNTVEGVCKQLILKPLISTIDHQGIWNHPIFVNSSLIYSLHFKPQEYAVVLATESVSLNNTSSWSGSLLHHNSNLNIIRHSLFPDKQKTLPVLSVPKIQTKNIEHLKNGMGNEFAGLIDVVESDEIGKLPSFSFQTSKISHNFWQKIFPSAPQLIYFPLETLVLQYLSEVFKDANNILSKLILTQEGRTLWQEYFGQEHTFMFWEVDEKGRRKALASLPTSTNEIIKQIQTRKIYPSSPLCFAVLLLAGFACVGGFTQTTWLTNTKEKLIGLLGQLSGGDNINNLPTQNFAESSLAWLSKDDKYFNPSSLDLFLTGQDYYPKYVELASKITLEQSLNLAMPTIYSVVVPKVEQDKSLDLMNIESNIVKELKLVQYL